MRQLRMIPKYGYLPHTEGVCLLLRVAKHVKAHVNEVTDLHLFFFSFFFKCWVIKRGFCFRCFSRSGELLCKNTPIMMKISTQVATGEFYCAVSSCVGKTWRTHAFLFPQVFLWWPGGSSQSVHASF